MKTTRILVLVAAALLGTSVANAQRVPQRLLRTYIPENQLVSFLPGTPFPTYLEMVNPIFIRVTGKQLIDPGENQFDIQIPISSMHFLDATEMILAYEGFSLRETEQYFVVEPDASLNPVDPPTLTVDPATGAPIANPADLQTKQVRISAVFFELNHTKAKDSGINWSVIFGEANAAAAAGGGSQNAGANASQGLSFFLKTDKLFEPLEDAIIAPSQVDFKDLKQLVQLAEASGIGETLSSPEVTVQSGQLGYIQIGQDVPIQKLDISGNTTTELIQTGTIVGVTPTVMTEMTEDSTFVDIIHMDVSVEKSSSRPTLAGPIIDRSQAETQVVTLNGEQVLIGGLYSKEQSESRRGVPVLKDLPSWFFGLKYLFSRSQITETRKELLLVLQADVVQPLMVRANQPLPDNILDERREKVMEALRRFNEQVAEGIGKSDNYRNKN